MITTEHTRTLQLLHHGRGVEKNVTWSAHGQRLAVKNRRGTYTVHQKNPYTELIETKKFSRVESFLQNYANGFYNVSCIYCESENVENHGKKFGFEDVLKVECSGCGREWNQPVRTEQVRQGKWL